MARRVSRFDIWTIPLEDSSIVHDDVAAAFELGTPLRPMTRVGGGNVHRMWRLDTDRGSWAVKQLRPGTALPAYLNTIEFEQAGRAAGVACPRAIEAATGGYLAEVDGSRVRVHE